MKTISILITCHNRKSKTLACLQGLFTSTVPQNYCYEVFLVDDGSTDGTSEAIKFKYPVVNIIQGNGDLYWNRGMLMAWKTAANSKVYDYYLWLNDDTIIRKDGLSVLFSADEVLLNNSILVGSTNGIIENSYTYGGYLLSENKKLLIPNGEFQQCDFFNGNIVLVPRRVFELVGYLDSIFHHSFGDFDYGLRAAKYGIKSYITPKAIGQCDANNKKPNWLRNDLNYKQRLNFFYLPTGPSPKESFYFEKRHLGLLRAIYHFTSIHIRFILRLVK